MEKQTTGTVVSVKKQWWLKINTKAFRKGTQDGAIYPYVIKVRYTVNGVELIRKKWIGARTPCPEINSEVTVIYQEDRPTKFRLDV